MFVIVCSIRWLSGSPLNGSVMTMAFFSGKGHSYIVLLKCSICTMYSINSFTFLTFYILYILGFQTSLKSSKSIYYYPFATSCTSSCSQLTSRRVQASQDRLQRRIMSQTRHLLLPWSKIPSLSSSMSSTSGIPSLSSSGSTEQEGDQLGDCSS